MGNTNKNLFRQFFQKLVVVFLISLSYLPLFILYFLSDIFYIIISKIIRYRKKVIISNLKNSFPEKTDTEIKIITRKFYRHFCDIFMEGLKIYSISQKNLEKRIEFKDLKLLDGYFDQGKSVVIVGMHFNNWEWCSLLPGIMKHQLIAVYSPVRNNKAFEKYMLEGRGRYNPIMVPMDKTPRMVIEFSRQTTLQAIWLLSDQSPQPNTKSWIRFLNQETAFFSGPEKIAFRTKQPIVFEYVKKISRGKYEVYHIPLFENYEQVESKDILIAYARMMEKIIREKPEYYLWSHRRWKHKRPENVKLLDE
ncbi:MAG: lysophospholipid acyltransferase family protein [Prolixibacteraceae bacterium]|nr:lysophospholipid acyltransferase family protein [Prolixibacteraceae bacterium]MBN2772617.1 lysophospholipid acyltransferase family protein [Prolixibacteraceae bacterium]